VQFRANVARMSDSQEGRSRQTHPGGLGDENKLASEHQRWPSSVRFLSTESKREVARLWLRLLRQKRRLTSLISDENENEFDPFFLSFFVPPPVLLSFATVFFFLARSPLHTRPCPRSVSPSFAHVRPLSSTKHFSH